MTKPSLSEIGEACYGEHWRTSLAKYLQVSRQTVHNWERNEPTLPARYEEQLAKLLRDRTETLKRIAARL